jgi:hypothetical protein
LKTTWQIFWRMDDQLIWRAGVSLGAMGVSLLLFRLWMKGRALMACFREN